jgi:hypothetical protein
MVGGWGDGSPGPTFFVFEYRHREGEDEARLGFHRNLKDPGIQTLGALHFRSNSHGIRVTLGIVYPHCHPHCRSAADSSSC